MPALVHGHGNTREKPNKRTIVLEEMANYGDKVGVLDMEGAFGLIPAGLQAGKSSGP